jgi:hypothetical protein
MQALFRISFLASSITHYTMADFREEFINELEAQYNEEE